MTFLHMSVNGYMARLALAEATSPEHVEQEIARLPAACNKIELFCGQGAGDDHLVAAAKAIAKSHVKNIEFQFSEGLNEGFQQALSVFTENNKQFNVLAHRHYDHYEQVGQLLNAMRTMRVAKLETSISSAGLDTFSKGVPEAKNLRGLELWATRFKKADFAQLKNSIERSESIQHVTVEPSTGTRQASCDRFVQSLQGHLNRNANYNQFIDLFNNQKSNHFLDGRKGHQFVSSFLGQIKLKAGNENSEAVRQEVMEKTDLIAKGLAKFLKPADAIQMAITSKATMKAVHSDSLSYDQVDNLRALYKSSARSSSSNSGTDSDMVRPGKRQKSAES